MAGEKAKGGKKNRKFGRNKVFCQRYQAEGRRIKNKIARLKRHIRHFPKDEQACRTLNSIQS